MAKLAKPEVLLKLMNCWNAFQHHAAARQGLELRHAGLIVGVQQQRGLSGRGRVPHHHSHGAVRGPHRDLLQQRAEHLDSAAAARQTQKRQAGLRCQCSVDPQGVVHKDAVGAALAGPRPSSGARGCPRSW